MTGATYTHVTEGGTYVVVGVATVHSRSRGLDGRRVVVLKAEDGSLHTRSGANFVDNMRQVRTGSP